MKRRLDVQENRTLNLMALDREERRRHKEANATEFYFGRQLAERMMARGAEEPKAAVSERVREVIKGVPETVDVLDLRPHLGAAAEGGQGQLSEVEIWEAVTACPHVTKLLLGGWPRCSGLALRSMAHA